MNRRKKNNLIIGVLCCALVFMGIGYALLNTTITIGGNANITGDFDIHFLTEDNLTTESGALKRGITLKNYASSTNETTVYNTSVTAKATEMEAATGINVQNPTQASFTAILQKPTDYSTFTAIAKNYGTIKGIISDVTITSTPSQELTTWLSNNNGGTWSDYFEVTTTAQQNAVLNPGDEYQFTITVRFKQTADKLPQGALNNTIEITYEQDNGGSSSEQITYVDQEDSCFVSFRPGEVNYYDSSKEGCGSNIVIPDNLRLKTSPVTNVTFVNQICLGYASYLKPNNNMTDQQFCDYIANQVSGMSYSDLYGTVYAGMVTPTYGEPSGEFNVITKVGSSAFANKTLTGLTLSNNITQISDAAFIRTSLSQVTLPNSLTSIGDYAFMFDNLTSLTIPSSLQSIGKSSFSRNPISTLNLSNATSLASIGNGAFYMNQITSLDFTNATSISSIGEGAFNEQYVGSYEYVLQTIIIPLTKSNWESQVSLGEDWYDSHKSDLQIIYSDVTCDRYNENCVDN